jgi:hypothetical protein
MTNKPNRYGNALEVLSTSSSFLCGTILARGSPCHTLAIDSGRDINGVRPPLTPSLERRGAQLLGFAVGFPDLRSGRETVAAENK